MPRFLVPMITFFSAFLTPAAVSAQLEISFVDGNPWDVFTIKSIDCPIADATLTIDFKTSVAGVVIDTEYGGVGTQDPMPAQLAAGQAKLVPVTDGDQSLVVNIETINAATPITLRMDLDDTAGARLEPRIMVVGGEIAGATAKLQYAGSQSTGTFDSAGMAIVPLPPEAPDCRLLS